MGNSNWLARLEIYDDGREILSTAIVSNYQVKRGFFGRITSIGPIGVDYGRFGRITRIGRAYFSYGWGGKIRSVSRDDRLQIVIHSRPQPQIPVE